MAIFTSAQSILFSGECLVTPLTLPDDPSLTDILDAAKGLLRVAHVNRLWVLAQDGSRRMMCVDEAAHDNKMPLNSLATTAYRAYMARAYPLRDVATFPTIAGTAVVFIDPIGWLDPT